VLADILAACPAPGAVSRQLRRRGALRAALGAEAGVLGEIGRLRALAALCRLARLDGLPGLLLRGAPGGESERQPVVSGRRNKRRRT
jgi:hypothetical protein